MNEELKELINAISVSLDDIAGALERIATVLEKAEARDDERS